MPTERLTLDPRNARKHPRRNLDAIKASLQEFGQRRPLVVTKEMVVVAGNGTLVVARELGMTEVAVTVLPWKDPDRCRAFALADNRTAELAQWDAAELEAALGDLVAADWDMVSLGFERAEDPGSVLEDEVPDPPAEPTTKPGDLWTLGAHRLLCGDSTDPDVIARLMAGDRAQMVFTDPPWNVAIGKDSNPKHRQREGLANDSLSPEAFAEFLERFVAALKPHVDGDFYCVLGASEWPRLDQTLRAAGYHWSATVIWVKDSFVLGRAKYHRRYEPIWYGWHEGGRSSFGRRRDLDDVWEIPRPKKSEEHPTMKPVAVPARAITASSRKGEIVADVFGGSGSTLIAAEQLGRACRTVELDPGYCDVIVQRWETLTGEKATRDG